MSQTVPLHKNVESHMYIYMYVYQTTTNIILTPIIYIFFIGEKSLFKPQGEH